ncbi:hypothetical protein PS673_01687 [Pseudomonas fluorescens]|uniref:Uncharacterized protein n=1 Tax=Pseudomonas fluorescens TaxID=294 RepID=A0A5E6RKL5_PSEFL|nr:hypothetical protein PS673_01687 [Pseudomonas fluorescens]
MAENPGETFHGDFFNVVTCGFNIGMRLEGQQNYGPDDRCGDLLGELTHCKGIVFPPWEGQA